ncbi:snRNA-activating protein complex subunit 2-like [Thalassophryne amazonica]|uniref:snRNA-activating protein complex subunit 2-like n=1 Tax=Thalassophryne amazonica TaxID=390379 RepID=UPI0014711F55|nr:snRNA-activating protein complex subunit 2-like [Thalassophryne amazonica]
MKPPPRQRSKPNRELSQSQVRVRRSTGLLTEWKRKERYQLLSALKKLERTAGGESEIDYVFLRKSVPTRTSFEIRSAVEALKNKVITSVKFKLHMQEKRDKKSLELWTDLACAVAGKLIEPISAAFSQMLIVSSTEPCTLKNSVPSQAHSPSPRRGRPISRTGPIGSVACLHVHGDSPGSKTTSAAVPVSRLRAPASSVPASKPPSSTPDTPTSSSLTIAASSAVATASLGSSECSPLLSTDSCPSSFDVKYNVDFEKIYCYLSAVHKQSDGCVLNPMESAIVLDLIMSLPEELPLLDCKKLHQHLKQVYKCLTAPAHLNQTREMVKVFQPNEDEHNKRCTTTPQEGFSRTQAPSSDFTKSDPKQNKISTDTSNQQDAAGASLNNTGLNLQSDCEQTLSQSCWSDDASMKSDDISVTWHCPPPKSLYGPTKTFNASISHVYPRAILG